MVHFSFWNSISLDLSLVDLKQVNVILKGIDRTWVRKEGFLLRAKNKLVPYVRFLLPRILALIKSNSKTSLAATQKTMSESQDGRLSSFSSHPSHACPVAPSTAQVASMEGALSTSLPDSPFLPECSHCRRTSSVLPPSTMERLMKMQQRHCLLHCSAAYGAGSRDEGREMLSLLALRSFF